MKKCGVNSRGFLWCGVKRDRSGFKKSLDINGSFDIIGLIKKPFSCPTARFVMAVVTISKDLSGRLLLTSSYDPARIVKIKTIPDHRWHPDKKYRSFPNTDGTTHPYPPHRRGRVRVGVKELESRRG
ncbi:MAG: hypothetical protein HZA09_01405 [Nitrospirae bacterium]|nr:hypothetical protein [Nitrospirota bacterium]